MPFVSGDLKLVIEFSGSLHFGGLQKRKDEEKEKKRKGGVAITFWMDHWFESCSLT